MPAPLRGINETRRLIVQHLKNTGRPKTWPDIRNAVGITAGYRTQKRMLADGEICEAGVDERGVKQYFAAKSSD